MALDAADKNSYIGSGTVWNDVSGNGNNGTLTNGPTFSNANGGCIVFDGVDEYVNVPYNASKISFCVLLKKRLHCHRVKQNIVFA